MQNLLGTWFQNEFIPLTRRLQTESFTLTRCSVWKFRTSLFQFCSNNGHVMHQISGIADHENNFPTWSDPPDGGSHQTPPRRITGYFNRSNSMHLPGCLWWKLRIAPEYASGEIMDFHQKWVQNASGHCQTWYRRETTRLQLYYAESVKSKKHAQWMNTRLEVVSRKQK
jgi:hypothetical protein